MEEHVRVGYKPRRWLVLPNGFDTQKFSPDDLARKNIRNQLGIDDSDFVVGMVGRYHRMKGFDLFAKAAGIAAQRNPRLRFVLVGTDVSEKNEELANMFKAMGICSRVLLLGQRRDIPDVMNGFDLLANTSTSEGFPNVVGEAMSCGLPCVVTDVGDSGIIVGQTGALIPPGDAETLAKTWQDFADMKDAVLSRMKASARQRILDMYDISVVARRYQELFENVAR
jgi:glycosyltransferase involved in cell wall biosynthesis